MLYTGRIWERKKTSQGGKPAEHAYFFFFAYLGEHRLRKQITPVPQAKGDRFLSSDHENNTQHSNDCLVALSV